MDTRDITHTPHHPAIAIPSALPARDESFDAHMQQIRDIFTTPSPPPSPIDPAAYEHRVGELLATEQQRLAMAASTQPAHLVPVEERRIVGYNRYADHLLVPVYETRSEPIERTPPRDLSPQPFLDPIAQRLLAGGLGGGALAAGTFWGLSQVIDAALAGGGGALVWAAAAYFAAKFASRSQLRGGGGGTTVQIRKAVIRKSHFHG